MNWFKPKQWKKIGEVTSDKGKYLYNKYAVMEHVKANGDRQYKQVFMCGWDSWLNVPTIESAPEDPLKEINEILKH